MNGDNSLLEYSLRKLHAAGLCPQTACPFVHLAHYGPCPARARSQLPARAVPSSLTSAVPDRAPSRRPGSQFRGQLSRHGQLFFRELVVLGVAGIMEDLCDRFETRVQVQMTGRQR